MARYADPRPRTAARLVEGARCSVCGYATAPPTAWCPACGGEQAPASFGPSGRVWSSTVVRIAVGERRPPYGLAFVDLDDGPRVLVHLEHPEAVPPGSVVTLGGTTELGDPQVRVTGEVLDGSRAASAPPGVPPRDPGLAGLDRTVAVAGVGTSGFGRFPDLRAEELAWAAVREALRDAGVTAPEVDAVWVGSVFAPGALIPRVLRGAGIGGVPVIRVENACASGTTAFHEAVHAVGTGRYGCVLALGVEQLSTAFDGPIIPDQTDPDGATGLALPALYALQAARYLYEHPNVTMDDVAAVAVKNKANGARNERAQLRSSPTMEDVLTSRPVADPLTFLQCCPLGDGAAAAIIMREGPVRVRSSALASGAIWDHRSSDLWGESCVRRAASAAYRDAGVTAAQIDVFEVHDAFTIGEVTTLEALDVASPGEGAALAMTGRSGLTGEQPVNPSGGLLSRGHPLGATGLAQIAELCWQLRGEAGDRQVDDPRLAVVETMGGGAAGVDGNACVVAVLERA